MHPLHNINLDLDPQLEAIEWAEQQLVDGQSLEQVSDDLATAGWSSEKVIDIVESARKATRAERGIVTRDDIVKVLDRKYRKSMSPLRLAGKVTGVTQIALFAVELRDTLRVWRQLRKKRS